MSRTRLTLAALLVVVFAGPAPAQQKGRKVAFLVGVGEFKHDLPDLSGTPQRDVTKLAEVLREGGFEVVILTDKSATKAEVEKTYKVLIGGGDKPAAALGKADLLLVAICTHGFTLPPAEGKPVAPFLAGHDAKLNKPATMVPLNGLIDEGKSSGATVLYLIDACRESPADANRGETRGIEPNQVVLPKGTSILFSCGRGQVSHQSEKLGGGHGLFTYAVLKTLRGDGALKEEVSWAGLVYDVEQTFRSAEFRALIPAGKPQRPYMAAGELDYTALFTVGGPLADDLRDYREAVRKGELLEHLRRVAPTCIGVWRTAAESGNPSGQFLYGLCYYFGVGVRQDDTKAVEWWQKAAQVGYPRAMYNLGVMYGDGRGVTKDEAKAVEWYTKAANAGEPVSMTNLGVMYEDGRGVAKDDAKAVEWYTKAAAAGDPSGMYNLGRRYANGRGVTKDDAKAVEWYTKAANAGEPTGMTSLGAMYANGRGVTKDDAKAVEWFTKAAAAGNPRGMTNLGFMYANGRGGLAKDEAKAVEWYTKAATAGDAPGMNNLGRMYEYGRGGLAKDEAKAVEWYKKAAALGDETATENLKRLGKE